MPSASALHLALLVGAHLVINGSCDVAGGSGSINALPAGGGSSRLAPSFDAATPRNVTALVGKSAYLSCRVRNLGNRTVSHIFFHGLFFKRDMNSLFFLCKKTKITRFMIAAQEEVPYEKMYQYHGHRNRAVISFFEESVVELCRTYKGLLD
ncbi:uncharacterized protein LOC114251731 [Bombyx mandarina]|uniref:Uncharacterized protein LOC114251731 n=1 Tax=Bombyx mandarina TaxID=7092 RepID=A0A6J2KLT0_BOMMA|nr:uncharacterized protein LOC114251731 [Bombyx mandarina]